MASHRSTPIRSRRPTDVLDLGLDTVGDVTRSPDGTPTAQPQVIRDVLEAGVLGDAVGVGVGGLGEHHRPDFAVSAAAVVLAGIAARTERIHLGSAVTALSGDDPIRVFQHFATPGAISRGRAEIILGPGFSSSPSRGSARTSPTTRRCSPRRWTCSRHCSPNSP